MLNAREAETLLRQCQEFRDCRMTLEELQSSVYIAAAGIHSVEQKDLRDFLNWAEGNLDSIRFTQGDEAAFQAALDVVDRIEIEMRPLTMR